MISLHSAISNEEKRVSFLDSFCRFFFDFRRVPVNSMRETRAQQAYRIAIHAPQQCVEPVALRCKGSRPPAADDDTAVRQTRSSSDQAALPGVERARSQPSRSTSNW